MGAVSSFVYFVIPRTTIVRRLTDDILDGNANHTKRAADPGLLQQIYCLLAGSFAVRRFPTFCAALVGGYTFLQWPLSLLLGYASAASVSTRVSSRSLPNASHATSRFLAAAISAWFSLEILNPKAIAKVEQTKSRQAALNQQEHVGGTGFTFQTAKMRDSKTSRASPPFLAGKTMDLTIFAVTRALDTLIVNLYRCSCPPLAKIAPASSTVTTISRCADTLIFVLSSATVVCLCYRAIPS